MAQEEANVATMAKRIIIRNVFFILEIIKTNKRLFCTDIFQHTILMKVHFISIGGSVMHQLAIALKKKGYTVTGTDDEIFEPSYSNLAKEGLLPEETMGA